MVVLAGVSLPLKYGVGAVVRDEGDEEEEDWEKPKAPCWKRGRQKQTNIREWKEEEQDY